MAHFQASEFAELCVGARLVGEGHYMAHCPAHDDSSPSLDIKDGDKGLLLHCYAGCDFADICESVGVKTQETFNNQDFVAKRYPPKDRELDEMVVFLFEEHRKQGTNFSSKDEETYITSKLRIAQNSRNEDGRRLDKV